MPTSISDQVVVVVGASSGIGRTTARMAADRGARVVVAARSESDLRSLVDEITAAGGSVAEAVADITDGAEVAAIADTAVARFGRIDTWVGCAAVSVYGKAWDIPADEYDAVMRTNWLGHVYGALAALPHLRSSGGTFIAIGSVESVRAVPLHAPYVASKMALRGFCDSLRMDLEAEDAGVGVTLVLPGPIDTPFFDHSRSYAEGAPKPPNPVYAPESVAQAILSAAERPQREIVVGGSSFGFLAGQKLAPRITDRLMTARQSMLRMQQADTPPRGPDNLDMPVEGTGTQRGGHGGRPSLSTAITSARPAVKRAAGLGAVAAGFVVSRLARGQGSQGQQPTRDQPGEVTEVVDLTTVRDEEHPDSRPVSQDRPGS